MRRPELIEPTPLGDPPYDLVPPEVEKAIRLGSAALSEPKSSLETAPLQCHAWLALGPALGLCSTSQGAYLVELDRRQVVRAYRASTELHLSLQPGPLLYRLELGEHTVSVRKRSAFAALQLLGLARLGYPSTVLAGSSSWLETPTEFEAALLGSSVGPNEVPLAFLPLSLLVELPSRWLGSAKARVHLLMTDTRLLLVAASIVGDRYAPMDGADGELLHAAQLRLLDDGRVQANGHVWKDPRAQQIAKVIQCARFTGAQRILEASRYVYTGRTPRSGRVVPAQSGRDALWVLELLEVVNASEGASQTSRILHSCIKRQPAGSATRTPLWTGNLPPPWTSEPCESNVAELWEAFEFDVTLGRWLLEELEPLPGWHVAALELSHAVWRRRLADAPSVVARIEADLDHAEYCMRLGAPERAGPLLVETRRVFPQLSLGDLNLPSFAPPSPYREVRKRLERAMIRLREGNPKSQTAARLRLVWLDPLNPEVLAEATLCPSPIGDRAKVATNLLRGPIARGGFGSTPPPSTHQTARALDESRIEDQLRHPLSVDKPGLLDRFKSAVAQIRTPDFATLKLYCERVMHADSPLLTVVDEAATLLGLGHVDVYISRGHDDVGVRAFRERNIVLLLGGQHVEKDSRHYLNPAELRFCIASELGHIRFGHRRVSPQDVVRGAIHKGKQGVDVALSVLPVLGGLRLTNRLGMVTAKLSLPQIDKAMRTARTLSQAVDSAMPVKKAHMDMSQANEELLEAHRLAQLSADRAGLVCCGDLPAAVLSLLKGRTDYVRVAAGVAEFGLLHAVEQQETSNALAFADLKLRVGSLISFYTSDEYEQLRRLAYPAVAPRVDLAT